ncbi:MAG: Na/Pi cotransporter family protein [Patescibacteria group bacterium]|nr:Na/Pi cotransporter family protein [Patescibacteria group bacterium]
MSITKIIFELAGGLALFLYGIFLLSEGFQKIAGDRLQKILEKFTNRPIKGIASGAAVTAIIQSSSITTVILLGFINAGLINLSSAAGVIMGANIGTTITAQIISFDLETLSLPIIAIGFLFWFISRNLKLKFWGQVLLGLGLLFLGMSLMSHGVGPLKENTAIFEWFLNLSRQPILLVLIGAAFTGLIQSSSATTGLVIVFAKEGLIGLEGAIPLILGANIGTCITVLLASIGSTKNAKRMALVHLAFNVSGALIFYLILSWFIPLVEMTASTLARQVANAHTIFNIVSTLILIPLIPLLIKLVKKVIPGQEIKMDHRTKFISKYLLDTPSIALGEAFKETMRMADISQDMMENSYQAFLDNQPKKVEMIKKQEEAIDHFYDKINNYCRQLSERNLSHEETEKLSMIVHNLTDIERVADHVNNIIHITKHKYKGEVNFTATSVKELNEMFEKAIEIYQDAICSWKNSDQELAKKVLHEEGEIDAMEKRFRLAHIARLEKGEADPASGVSFESLLENLERIGDHSDNIAYSVIHGF